MRKTFATAALVLALCCPALAGEMHTPVKSEPAPAPPAAQQPTTDGEMHYPLIQLALDLFALI